MRVTDIDNPVRLTWLLEQGLRFDSRPYLSGGLEARKLLDRLPGTVSLSDVTAGYGGGIYNGPKFRRVYVTDPAHGVPFLGSTDMLEIDFTTLPLLRRSDAESPKLSYLRLRSNTSLISCSGTVGRMAFSRPDMDGTWTSQDILKVEADENQIPPGYLYTFLRSKFGVPIVTSSAYGAVVQHIEPHHIKDLPVPRFDREFEARIDSKVRGAAELRASFQAKLVGATADFFRSTGLPHLAELAWHQRPRELGFQVAEVDFRSLRALNFSPRAREIIDALTCVPHLTLGEICERGQLSRGVRFKRVEADSEHGVQLIGQRQAFWARPEGRWISRRAPNEIFAQDEDILVAAQGTLGENEVFCRSIFASGAWLNHAYSEHFLRIRSGRPDIPGAYLFAFMRSTVAFRLLRSLSVGSKQQDIHEGLRTQIPIPLCMPKDRERIAETVRSAHHDRDAADQAEDDALNEFETAVREAAR